MREIKFRAWDKDNNCMVHDWYKITEEKLTKGRFLGRQAQTLATVFMQFTGLKDKNGKEIFEGDIIEGKLDEWSDKGKVIFRDGAFQIEFKDGHIELVSDLATHDSEWEVIGNIYENPELLEDNKK